MNDESFSSQTITTYKRPTFKYYTSEVSIQDTVDEEEEKDFVLNKFEADLNVQQYRKNTFLEQHLNNEFNVSSEKKHQNFNFNHRSKTDWRKTTMATTDRNDEGGTRSTMSLANEIWYKREECQLDQPLFFD